MSKNLSFGEAVYSGAITGPDWPIVDAESGQPIEMGSQNFGHTQLGRWVLRGDSHIGTILDIQQPANTPPELRDPEVRYSAFES